MVDLWQTRIINPEDRNIDGKYNIEGINLDVFPFSFDENNFILINVGDTHFQRRQNFSLRMWFSTKPGGIANIPIALPNNMLSLPLFGVDFVVFGENTGKPSPEHFERTIPKTYLKLVPGKTYYVNILNVVNQLNSFELNFTEERVKEV